MPISDLIARLKLPAGEPRAAAYRDLRQHRAELSTHDRIALIRATTAPEINTDERQYAASAIFVAMLGEPRPELASAIAEVFPQLRSRGREAALTMLAECEDATSIRLFVKLATDEPDALGPPVLLRLAQRTAVADLLSPLLIEKGLKGPEGAGALLVVVNLAEKNAIAPQTLRNVAARVSAALATQRGPVEAAVRDVGIAWMWNEDYAPHRAFVGALLALLRYLPADIAESRLRGAATLRDPALALAAVASLVVMGRDVAPAVLNRLVETPEIRAGLWDLLSTHERLDLFPAHRGSAAALAEAGLAQWLTQPTALGRAPDEIVAERKITTGLIHKADYYVFRFRTLPPHWAAKDGWMYGVAGPFDVKAPPTPHAAGTLSRFRDWIGRQPEDIVAEVRRTLRE